MPTLNGITVRVFCDGLPLEEYATSVGSENSSVVSCWIASTTDKEFEVHYAFGKQELCGWGCHLYCDGVVMAGHALRPGKKNHIQNAALSGGNEHPIIFSEMVETDSQEETFHGNPDLGLIKVNVWRIKADWEIVNQPLRKVTVDESPIHETKKMLGGHRVKLGEPRVGDATSAQAVYLDKTPYTTFIFHYRPLALLRALGHAPLASSNPATAVKRSASVLSESDSSSESNLESGPDSEDEQITKLKQQIKARKAELAKAIWKVESKSSKHGKHKFKRLKREEATIVVPPSMLDGVIDLCSD